MVDPLRKPASYEDVSRAPDHTLAEVIDGEHSPCTYALSRGLAPGRASARIVDDGRSEPPNLHRPTQREAARQDVLAAPRCDDVGHRAHALHHTFDVAHLDAVTGGDERGDVVSRDQVLEHPRSP